LRGHQFVNRGDARLDRLDDIAGHLVAGGQHLVDELGQQVARMRLLAFGQRHAPLGQNAVK
jgi:putative hemolysin